MVNWIVPEKYFSKLQTLICIKLSSQILAFVILPSVFFKINLPL
jgi:hypothetical protein